MKKKSLKIFFDEQIEEHILVARRSKKSLYDPFSKVVSVCIKALKANKKIIVFGNGGSASDSQHIATELTVRFSKNRKAIPAIAITTDTSALTAIGNDLGFKYLFSRQIEALGSKGDISLGISTSGKSKNIIYALEESKKMGLTTISFTGAYKKELEKVSNVVISVPAKNTSRIQEMHITIGQMLCNAIEEGLKLSKFVESEK